MVADIGYIANKLAKRVCELRVSANSCSRSNLIHVHSESVEPLVFKHRSRLDEVNSSGILYHGSGGWRRILECFSVTLHLELRCCTKAYSNPVDSHNLKVLTLVGNRDENAAPSANNSLLRTSNSCNSVLTRRILRTCYS